MAERSYRPPEPKPAKVGLYEVTPPISTLPRGSQFYSYWDGAQWCASSPRWPEAVAMRDPAHVQNKSWRECKMEVK